MTAWVQWLPCCGRVGYKFQPVSQVRIACYTFSVSASAQPKLRSLQDLPSDFLRQVLDFLEEKYPAATIDVQKLSAESERLRFAYQDGRNSVIRELRNTLRRSELNEKKD